MVRTSSLHPGRLQRKQGRQVQKPDIKNTFRYSKRDLVKTRMNNGTDEVEARTAYASFVQAYLASLPYWLAFRTLTKVLFVPPYVVILYALIRHRFYSKSSFFKVALCLFSQLSSLLSQICISVAIADLLFMLDNTLVFNIPAISLLLFGYIPKAWHGSKVYKVHRLKAICIHSVLRRA